jgi:hypothetical protein
MGSADSDAGSQFAVRFYIESLRANEQRSLRFVSICGEIGAVRWLSYLEADLWRISSCLTCDSTAKRLLILIRKHFGHVAGSWRRFSRSACLWVKKNSPQRKRSGPMERMPRRRYGQDSQ